MPQHEATDDLGGFRAALLAAALLLGYQLLPLPLTALAAVVFLVCAWRWPVSAVVAVVVALPYDEVLRPVVGSWSFSAAEVGILLAALGVALRALAPPDRIRLRRGARNSPGAFRMRPALGGHFRSGLVFTDWAALALVVIAVGSLAVSIHPKESLRALRQTILEPVLLYALLVWIGAGRASARKLLVGLVAAAVVVSAVGIYQYATNQNIITAEESLRRIRGFYGSPNQLGLFLGRALPVALALAATGGAYRRWCALALVPISVALLLTFSLGAWVGAFVAVALVALLLGRRVALLGGAGFAALAAVATPLLLQLDRIRSHFDLSDGTTFLRFQLWMAALNLVWDHPIFGVGLDNFLYYYRDLGYMLPGGWQEPSLSHPHDLVLDFWLSLGLAGLVLALALLYRYFRDAYRLSRLLPSRADQGLAIALVASMADFVAHGLIDASYFRPDLAMIFWLSLAILRLLKATTPRDGTSGDGTARTPADPQEARA